MKGDHALALTAYVVLSVAVIGVSVDQFETNQATTPSSASSASTPDGSADGGPRVAPGGDPVASRDTDGHPVEPSAGTPEQAVETTEASAPGAVVPGAQPRPPVEAPDSPSTIPAPETSSSEPGDTGSAVPCPGDDSVLVTPLPSGDLCPSPTPDPVPTDDPGLELDLDPLGELDLPGLDFGSVAEPGSAD